MLVTINGSLRCAAADPAAGSRTSVPGRQQAFVPPQRPPLISRVGAPAPAFFTSCSLRTDQNKPLLPSAAVFVGNDIYCLDTLHVWLAPNAVPMLQAGRSLVFADCGPKMALIDKIPVQEFSNFAYSPARNSLVVLDKTGDVFEMSLPDRKWHILRPNSPMGSPDPEYIDIAVSGKNVIMLDPERNQIWRYPATSRRYFKDVLPWRVRPGDVSVADGIGLAYDGCAWVLRSNGAISKYAADADSGMAKQLQFKWQKLPHLRPSRLFTAGGAPLYVVERENNRVLAIDKSNGAPKQFLFPPTADLRGLIPVPDGFWVINADRLEKRDLSHADSPALRANQRQIDARLAGLMMPIKGGRLPRHPGVWAGARRLYRYGVHHGTDFFDDPGQGTHVSMDTPVYAADAGKVIRADANFKDMDSAKYSYVMYQCTHNHISSESNEDLLRGCQVWIDHGNGLITRYAHLDKIRPGLKPGMKLAQGDLVGYVGVSGTGENLPGRAKHPHLHFEIWLDGKYVGWGLTPAETIGVYEDIFGSSPKG
jgi:murein DD-endopeptidase MepM/ murein hydrolase activator NlpD